MSWIRLPDGLADEGWELGDGALRLHICALAWSSRTGADGRIPASRLPAIAPASRTKHARDLVAAGWWAEQADGYLIVRHLSLQFTREEDELRREEERLKKLIARRSQLGENVDELRRELGTCRVRSRALRERREQRSSLTSSPAMSPGDSPRDSRRTEQGKPSAPVPVPERNEG